MRDVFKLPQLLVSVRSVREADVALAGGAEILDVKEPARGSLGMASIEEISLIARRMQVDAPTVPLSVAVGELVDWFGEIEVPTLPAGITFAKMGLSQTRGRATWLEDWRRVRSEFDRRAAAKLKWVAVAYSDAAQAASPELNDVVAAAIETGCAGLLVDTWTKDGRTLLDGIDPTTIQRIGNELHDAGLFFAIAGQLNVELLPRLRNLPADILAIRSAGCAKNQRTLEINQSLVEKFRQEMRAVYVETASKQSRPCTTVR